MNEEVYEIGNGQMCETGLHTTCGTLDCMHDQKALLIRGENGRSSDSVRAEKSRQVSESTWRHLSDSKHNAGGQRQPCISKGNEMTKKAVIRRLTPLECERLQGFPDHWTDIGEWTDSKGKKHKASDSPRYKALGNSIALPFWEWLAGRMVGVLRAEGNEHPTMASLFDGIGGFPLVYQRQGCEPIWASEIEEFPIAVTKKHFPETEERTEENG